MYRMQEIVPHLYLSTYYAVRISNAPFFAVNCSEDLPMARHEGVRIAVTSQAHFYEDLLSALPTMHNQIQQGHNVVVYCNTAQQSSPVVICAYLMWKHGHSLESAIRLVREKRKDALFWSVDYREALELFAALLRRNEF